MGGYRETYVSNKITNAIKHWQSTPAQKAVLMCLADRADDKGEVFQPSIPMVTNWTCLSRTAVIQAMKALEAAWVISVDRTKGCSNRVRVLLDSAEFNVNQCGKRTSTADAPVRDTNRDQCGKRTTPVRQTHGTSAADAPYTPNTSSTPKHQVEHSQPGTSGKAGTKRISPDRNEPCPNDVDPQVWCDWLSLRKSKRAPVSKTVIDEARLEAIKASMTFESFLREWISRGSQGFKAEWIKPDVPKQTWQQRSGNSGKWNGAGAAIFGNNPTELFDV